VACTGWASSTWKVSSASWVVSSRRRTEMVADVCPGAISAGKAVSGSKSDASAVPAIVA
jgi:hypothetical protein